MKALVTYFLILICMGIFIVNKCLDIQKVVEGRRTAVEASMRGFTEAIKELQ